MGTPTQVKQAKNIVPASIRLGRIILLVCSILFFAFTILNCADFVCRCLGISGDWQDPYSAIWTVLLPFISFYLVFAGIGGISYARDRGPFIGIASLTAILSAILGVVTFMLEIRSLLNSGVLLNLNMFYFVEGVVCFVYFLDWMLAKNWLD